MPAMFDDWAPVLKTIISCWVESGAIASMAAAAGQHEVDAVDIDELVVALYRLLGAHCESSPTSRSCAAVLGHLVGRRLRALEHPLSDLRTKSGEADETPTLYSLPPCAAAGMAGAATTAASSAPAVQ